ncbi:MULTISPECIES: zinc metallochaperone AztD [unclassified Sinorhizobium]|uniref:zinc metallochaperone AztD n=1 Tax=unclassified Sinorhizobium TaxID=2613772 RepID=UPI0035240DE4
MISRSTMVGSIAAAGILTGSAYAEEERQAWRLFVADHTAPIARSFDAMTGRQTGEFGLKGYAALSASGSGRTVFAVQTEADTVQAIKSGVTLSDHGEHRDLEMSEPELLQVAFDGKRPVHAVMHGDDVVLFYDREGKARLLSEEGILTGEAHQRTIDATAPHHGVAVPMGENMLVSVPDTKAETKPDELPPRLGLRVLDASGGQIGEVEPCSALHGEAFSARLVAFGCEEGVLIARPGKQGTVQLKMLEYGEALPKGKVTTLLGSKAMQFFLGNYGEDKIALIDPESAEPYRLVDLPTRRIDFALDPARIKNAYVLTEDGQLHVIDILNGKIRVSATVTEPYSKDGHWRDPRPRLAVAGDEVAITDPRHGLVRMIDIDTMKEVRTIAVEGQPFSIVAVGGSGTVH